MAEAIFINSLDFAQDMDARDSLSSFKSQFHLPEINGKTQLYFCGNSLGLQPKEIGRAHV